MAHLEGEVTVKKSRREVYGYLMELQTRSAFMPQDFGNFRLTSVNPFGVGATLAFDARLAGQPANGHFVLSVVLPPEGITEQGRVGDVKWTLRYALTERDDGSTVIKILIDWSVTKLLKKPLERFVYAPVLQRWHGEMLARVKQALDSETSHEQAARLARSQAGYKGAQYHIGSGGVEIDV